MHQYRKAIASAIIAGLFSLISVWPHGITSDEWGIVIGAVLAGGGLTGLIPNRKA